MQWLTRSTTLLLCSHIDLSSADLSARVQVRYMERDAADLQAAGAGAQHRDAMQDIFLQVSRSADCRACW
jgi:hypothetical protein